MTTNPQLPNHLIRELMHTIRFKGEGDAMVLLALSGKETFPVFRYVVQTRITLRFTQITSMHLFNSKSYNEISPSVKLGVTVSTNAAMRVFSRFVRDLTVIVSPRLRLPIDWANLEWLAVFDHSGGKFLDDIAKGTILMPNLRELLFSLTFENLMKIVSIACFPFPEKVTLVIEQKWSTPSRLGPYKTFSGVKHLKIIYSMRNDLKKFEVLNELPTIIKCFSGLESVKIVLRDHQAFTSNQPKVAEVAEFHKRLRTADFSVPVDVNYREDIVRSPYDDPEVFYDELKSMGFKEKDAYEYVFSLDDHNVKLFHQINFLQFIGWLGV